MGKTKRFEIYGQEPAGTTFEDVSETKWAGDKNKKRSARFGVENDEPEGPTFLHAGSHIDFPKADRGPKLGNKVIDHSSGQGEYNPGKEMGVNASEGHIGGSIPVGKSSPKHGQKMKPMKAWK